MSSLPKLAGEGVAVLPDIRPSAMAKAIVRTPDIEWNAVIGAAIQQAVRDAGFSNKEAAAKADVDDAEFGKWLSGGRRPHFDKLFAIPELRQPLVIALAQLGGVGVEVVTEIRLKRSAR